MTAVNTLAAPNPESIWVRHMLVLPSSSRYTGKLNARITSAIGGSSSDPSGRGTSGREARGSSVYSTAGAAKPIAATSPLTNAVLSAPDCGVVTFHRQNCRLYVIWVSQSRSAPTIVNDLL